MANEFIVRNGLIAKASSIISGSLTVTAPITGSGAGLTNIPSAGLTAPGSDTQVLFNSDGSLAANSGLVYSGSRLGIGTTNPLAPLDVNGNIYSSGNLLVNTIFSRGGSSDLNLDGRAGYGVNVRSGSTSIAYFDYDTANVGIGTTSPSYKLHINAANNGINLSGANSYLRWQSGDMQIRNEGSYKMGFYTYNTSDSAMRLKMVLDTNGNVGIGEATPSAKLHVSGTSDVLLVEGSGSTIFDVQGSQGQLFSVTDSLVGSLFSVNDISGLPIIEVFDTDKVVMGTFGQNTLVVTGSNVGIGTTSPARKLHVSTGNTDIAARFENTTSNGTVMELRTSGDGKTMSFQTDHIYVNAGSMHFGNYTGDIYLRPSASGKVGIGTTAPTQKLTVQGNISASGDIYVGDDLFVGSAGNGAIQVGSIGFLDGTSTSIFNMYSPGDIYLNADSNNNGNSRIYLKESGTTILTAGYDGVRIYDNLTVDGIVTAQEFHTEFVSASILYSSGSTKFGDTDDDTHNFTGSLIVSRDPGASLGTVMTIENTGDYGSAEDLVIKNPFDRDIGIKFETAGGANYIWQDSNGDDSLHFSDGDKNTTLELYQDQRAQFNGNVGIGVTPGAKLDISAGSDDGIRIAANNAFLGSTTAGDTQLIYWGGDHVYYGRNPGGTNGVVRSHSFRTNGNTKMYITGSSVGINTQLPTGSLHVVGSGYFEGESLTYGFDQTYGQVALLIDEGDYIYTRDSNVTLRKLIGKASDVIHIGQTGTSLIDEIRLTPGTTNGIVSFYNDNSEYARFQGGSLGIGTNNPGYELEVVGHVSASAFSGSFKGDGSGLQNVTATVSLTEVLGTGNDAGGNDIDNVGALNAVSLNATGTISGSVLNAANNAYFGGSVGIGTTSPGEKLHVKGDVRAESGANTSGTVRNKGYLLWSDDAFGMQLHHDGSSWGTAVFARSYDSDVRLGHYNASVSGQNEFTSSLVVKYTGNVGIGTSNIPTAKLQVAGIISGSKLDLPRGGYITFYGDDDGTGDHSISARDANGNASDDLRINSFHNVYVNLDSNNNNSSATTSFSISQHGGTGTLGSSLFSVRGDGLTTVTGDLTVTGALNATASYATNLVNIPSLAEVLNSGEDGGGFNILDIASIEASGTVTAGTFVETSARRFKENIEPISNSLEILSKIDGITFNRIGEERREYGFIADDILDVAPELVSHDENGEVHGVHYARTVAILTEAVKELDNKVKAQDLFIKDLVARIEKLENK